MFVIIGLGNPGAEYDGTRHNIGFAVVDAIARSLNLDLQAGRGEYVGGWKLLRQREIILVKPLTYMNNSGVAIAEIIGSRAIPMDQLLVVVDDFHLPLGTLRLQKKGSDGGHNGLYSIIYHLQSENFPRLRCGIGGETMPVNRKEMAGYVLSPFEKEEKAIVIKMIERASTIAGIAATENIDAAIGRLNASNI